MTINQSIREYYNTHKEKIEEWLDSAVYKPATNFPQRIPKKVDFNKNRDFRRFCLLHYHFKFLKFLDLSNSKKVLDIGAGAGDFAIYADKFNFERFDATDPGTWQYDFIIKKFNYYDNVYNLPLEEVDMSEYDTVLLIGLWIPDWVEVLKEYILPNKNIKNIVIVGSLLDGNEHLFLNIENQDAAPWHYNRQANVKRISFKMMNLILKSKSFYLKNSFSLKNDPINYMSSKYYLHYQRD